MRHFSSTNLKVAPTILRAKNGSVIPYPSNASSAYNFPIGHVGIDAVQHFLPDTTTSNCLRNQAQLCYLNNREHLLVQNRSKWMATSSNNDIFIGNSEKFVRDLAEKLFRDIGIDYYLECIGCEVLGEVHMDGDITTMDNNGTEDKCALYVDGEFSADQGRSFHKYRFKHDTGAVMMGAPANVLSQHTLRRGRDEIYVGPNGNRHKANTYEDIIIKVSDTPVVTKVIEARTWLLGYTVYSKFINIIDTDSNPPIIMTPKGRKNI